MALKDTWVNKINDEDFVMAEDINQIAQSVIDIEDELRKRFKWKGDYVENANYNIGDAVFYNGSSYICITAIDEGETFSPPNEDYWELLASKGADGKDGTNGKDGRSFVWCGEFDENEEYKVDDVVEYNGSAYICIKDKDNDQSPTDPLYWQLLVAKGKDGADGIGLPTATTEDSGKIIEVDANGEYVLKDLADSSVKTYIDDYINSALGGDY